MMHAWARVLVQALLVGLCVMAPGTRGQRQGCKVAAAAAQHLAWQPTCMGPGGRAVDWWVLLKHPGGYAASYIDSEAVRAPSGCGGEQRCWQHGLSMAPGSANPVGDTLQVLLQAEQVLGQQQQEGGERAWEGGSHRHAAASAGGGTGSDNTTGALAWARVVKQRPRQPAARQQQQHAHAPSLSELPPLAYVIYNDEDPSGVEHFAFAHAKGVAAFGGDGAGFWMVHSAPRYPAHPSSGPGFAQLQHPQSLFAQHFLCVSINGSSGGSGGGGTSGGALAAVASLLLSEGPFIYAARLPPPLAAAHPAWRLLLAGYVDPAARFLVRRMYTVAGEGLLAFAKTPLLLASLPDVVVAPALRSSMLWATWRRGADALPSLCPPSLRYSSLNVAQLHFPATNASWHWSVDHSKWGVSSKAGGRKVVCLGDMNRAAWQAHRGGAFVCIEQQGLWLAFRSLVAEVEPCWRPPPAAAATATSGLEIQTVQ